MFDVLIAVLLLALGFWNGYLFGKKQKPREIEPPTPEERELLRLREERAAFQSLMDYTADRAYGMEE